MKNTTLFRDKVIHQAGFFRSNDWVIVGSGRTLEEAKAQLSSKLFHAGKKRDDYDWCRYEESSYVYTAAAQERDQ